MRKRFFLGSDIGTSSCKTIIISSDGEVMGQASKEYWPISPTPGWAEIDPEQWYQAFLETFESSCKTSGISPADIVAIGLTGQMVTVAFIDEDKKPLRPAILWYDERGFDELSNIQSKLGRRALEITRNPLNSTFTLPKLLWVQRNQPEIFNSIHKILWASNYVCMKLTGNLVTDPTLASSSYMYDLKQSEWSQEIVSSIGVPGEILPSVKNAFDIAGLITDEVSAKTGLRAGIPVVTGTGDVSADNLAAGLVKPGQGMIRFGTCATISISLDTPVLDEEGKCPFSAHSIPGVYILEGTSAAFGSSVRWFRDVFYLPDSQKSTGNEDVADLYQLLDREAASVPEGADGLFFHSFTTAAPYWVPNLRGQFIGINSGHRRGHFARAVFEGTAYDLQEAMNNLSGIGVKMPKDFVAVGRGTLSKIWCQTISNVLGITLVLTKEADASLGAAMLAGIGTGGFRDFEDAVSKCVHYIDKVEPDVSLSNFYKQQFKRFKLIHESLVEMSKSLSKKGLY